MMMARWPAASSRATTLTKIGWSVPSAGRVRLPKPDIHWPGAGVMSVVAVPAFQLASAAGALVARPASSASDPRKREKAERGGFERGCMELSVFYSVRLRQLQSRAEMRGGGESADRRRGQDLAQGLAMDAYGRTVTLRKTGGVTGLLSPPSAPRVVGTPASASTASMPFVTLPKIT